jgi:trans-aconitate methyltransferase
MTFPGIWLNNRTPTQSRHLAEHDRGARKRLPDVRFDLANISAWSKPDQYGVILANAVLQWVPDHETLLPRLASKLAADGCWPCRCRTTSTSRRTG